MKKLLLIFAFFMAILTGCSSEEPEPTYNWWVKITVNMYEVGDVQNELIWIKETRHEERYELDKTEQYMEEQKSKFDGVRTKSDKNVYIFNYEYRKVDYIPIK